MGLGDSPEMAAKPPGTCASGSCHHLRLKRCSRERCQPELPRREHGQELRSWGEGAGEETPPPAPPALQAAPLTLSRNQGAQEPVGSAPKAQRTGTGGEAEITSLAHQMRTGRGPKALGVASCVAFSLPSALRAPFWGSDFRSDTSDTSGGFSCPGGRGARFHPTGSQSHMCWERGLFLSESQTRVSGCPMRTDSRR